MNINDAFPSKFLKAGDLEGEVIVTMRHVENDTIGDDTKPVLYFDGWDKGLVLNKTNAMNIAQIYGPETSGWLGKSMTMTTAWVDFQGRSVESIRLYPPKAQSAPQSGNAGIPVSSGHQKQDGDPRGDIPPATSADEYGRASGRM